MSELSSPGADAGGGMKGLFAGLVIGLLAAAGGYTLYHQSRLREKPCLDRCGQGTICLQGRCQVLEQKPAPPARVKKRRRRRARRRAPATGPRRPTAAQLKTARGGKALDRVDYLNLAQDTGGTRRELSSAQVTSRVRRLDPEIIACIQKAGRGYDLSGGEIKVEVGFRIERSGRVERVQVQAPRLLLDAGLLACIRPLLRNLVFPESSRALIMTYPYALN